ncbi:hypothetical protein GC173_01210 [bacterium]|nr:hypothetical protein [bacterium]
MDNSWITDLLRTVMMTGAVDRIDKWAHAFLEGLQSVKPDHEAYLFGVSRVPRMPNALLAASGEKEPLGDHPPHLYLTEQTVDIFLGPRPAGVRIIKEEYPLAVACEIPGSPKRREIAFYEAICFDGPHSSLVMGLVIHDGTVSEFLQPDEIGQLLPIIRAHAIPLLELYQHREMTRRQDEEIKLMMGVVRDSSGEASRMNLSQLIAPTPLPTANREQTLSEASFLQYLTGELRTLLNQNLAATEKLSELTRGQEHSHELASSAYATARQMRRILRNLANMASLAHPEVRPRRGAFSLQQLVRSIYTMATDECMTAQVRLRLEENTRNIYLSGDRETILKMVERIIKFSVSFCPEGTELIVRTDDNPDRVEAGFVSLEIEDLGQNAREINPGNLLVRAQLNTTQHPRLRRGGGILFQMLQLYMEKSGGKFRLTRGLENGFCVQLILPLVSRAEMEKLKAGEIA